MLYICGMDEKEIIESHNLNLGQKQEFVKDQSSFMKSIWMFTTVDIFNNLIAEFMQYPLTKKQQHRIVPEEIATRTIGDNPVCDIQRLKFNASWNWLMPVVEKIEQIGFCFYIHNDAAYIRKSHYKGNIPDFGKIEDTKITATWLTVVDFIKWHNSNEKKSKSAEQSA